MQQVNQHGSLSNYFRIFSFYVLVKYSSYRFTLCKKRMQDPELSFQHTCHDTQCLSSTDLSRNIFQKFAVKVENHLNFGKQMSQVQGKRKKLPGEARRDFLFGAWLLWFAWYVVKIDFSVS